MLALRRSVVTEPCTRSARTRILYATLWEGASSSQIQRFEFFTIVNIYIYTYIYLCIYIAPVKHPHVNPIAPRRFIKPMAFQQQFHSSMLRFCSMHVINCVMQYLNGGGLDLLLEFRYFGQGPLVDQLTEVTESFRKWASSSQIRHSQCYLTPGTVLGVSLPHVQSVQRVLLPLLSLSSHPV